MNVSFKTSFIKDFRKLPAEIKEEVWRVCATIFPKLAHLREFYGLDIRPIRGFRGYYRMRFGDYRVGLKEENGEVVFMRVKHRKDIYKVFP